MKTRRSCSESGQSLVLVALGFLAFVAILALVLDGGNAYAAKRQAQNAADAGALAGAQYLCQHRNEIGVEGAAAQKAKDYAGYNGADNYADVVIDLSGARVDVTATVTKPTFFAGVIGFENVSPKADAAAECRPPGVGTLPVAWSCRENVVGEVKCTEDTGPCRTEADPTGLKCTYILMDSVKVRQKGKPCTDEDPLCYIQNDLTCSEQLGTPPNCHPDIDPSDPADANLIDCDIDNDCVDELAAGGSRSWLDLNGTPAGGAGELKDWISGAEPVDPIEVHTWLGGESGVATSIFKTVEDYDLGKNVILPVFNKSCNGLPSVVEPESLENCNAGEIDNMDLITGSTFNYHINSFSAFHISCVQLGKTRAAAEPGYFIHPGDKSCYGHEAAVANQYCDPITGQCVGSIDDNDKTIEGYFVRLNLGGFGGPGDWYDTGTFTVVLVH